MDYDHSFLDVDAHEAHEVRRAAKQAATLSATRARNQFRAFLHTARTIEDHRGRLELIKDDVHALVYEACAEAGHGEPERLANVVMERLAGDLPPWLKKKDDDDDDDDEKKDSKEPIEKKAFDLPSGPWNLPGDIAGGNWSGALGDVVPGAAAAQSVINNATHPSNLLGGLGGIGGPVVGELTGQLAQHPGVAGDIGKALNPLNPLGGGHGSPQQPHPQQPQAPGPIPTPGGKPTTQLSPNVPDQLAQIHHDFSQVNPGASGSGFYGQQGQAGVGQAYNPQHMQQAMNAYNQQSGMHLNQGQFNQALQGYHQNPGAYPYHASVHEARKPKMCPYHRELVDSSLQAGAPQYNAFAGLVGGPAHCQGGFDGTCNFKPAMVTQEFWDAKEQEYEQRRLDRDQQLRDVPIPEAAPAGLEDVPDALDGEGVTDIDGELQEAPSAVGEMSDSMALSHLQKRADQFKQGFGLPGGVENLLGQPHMPPGNAPPPPAGNPSAGNPFSQFGPQVMHGQQQAPAYVGPGAHGSPAGGTGIDHANVPNTPNHGGPVGGHPSAGDPFAEFGTQVMHGIGQAPFAGPGAGQIPAGVNSIPPAAPGDTNPQMPTIPQNMMNYMGNAHTADGASAPKGADGWATREELPDHERETFATGLGDEPSPKMDKRRWRPNALDSDPNLHPIETDKGTAWPTHQQDVDQKPDYKRDDFRSMTDAVADHDVDVTQGSETKAVPSPTSGPYTWSGEGGQADPVSREALSKVDPDKNPLRDILAEQAAGLVPQSDVQQAIAKYKRTH